MSKIKYEIERVEAGMIAAGNFYEDTGEIIQDDDMCWKVSTESSDYYFESEEYAKTWALNNL